MKANENGIMNRIMKSVKGSRFLLFISLILVTILSLLNVLNAYSLQLLLDIATGNSAMILINAIIIALGVVLFTAIFRGVNTYILEKAFYKISLKVKSVFLHHVERIPFLKYKEFHIGDILTRFSDDTEQFARILPHSGINLIMGILSCIFALSYTFYLNWKMTILVLCISPLAIIWGKILLPHVQELALVAREKDSATRSYSQEQLNNVATIKSFSGYKLSLNTFIKSYKEFSRESLKNTALSAVLSNGGYVFGFLSFVLTVAYGSYLVVQKEMTVGAVIGFAQMLNFIVWPFTEMIGMLGNLQGNLASGKRLFEIMDIPIEDEETEIIKSVGNALSLQLKNVSFTFGNNKILENANLKLTKPQLVNIKGPSGAGKSTLLNILLALYVPAAGTVEIVNGENVFSGNSVRQLIAYVPQDHILLSGTIEENIKFVNLEASDKDMLSASKKAGIHEYIMTLPDGYQTQVSENAKNLSFRQAQRIAIARALLKDSPIIVLDEPTASLDKQTELLILETLLQEAKEKLIIMVSHGDDMDEKFSSTIIVDNKTASLRNNG